MDILKSLLTAYKDDIESEMSGGVFDSIRAVYRIVQPEIIPPDFSTPLPCILVYSGASLPVQNECLGAFQYEKNYEITLTVIMEGWGEEFGLFGKNTYKGLYDTLSDIESRYHAQTFDLSQACELIRLGYESRRIAPFYHPGILQGHVTLRHRHLDMRAA